MLSMRVCTVVRILEPLISHPWKDVTGVHVATALPPLTGVYAA